MDDKQKEPARHVSLFERIRDNILKTSGTEEKEEEKADVIPHISPVHEEASPAVVSHLLDIPTNSLLYCLWHEWNEAVNGDGEEAAGEPMDYEGVFDPLEIILDDADGELPLNEMEIDAERQRAIASLLMKAKKQHMITRHNEEGIAPTVDAEVMIHVARKRMAAWAFVFPPSGEGKPLTRQQLDFALAEHSVCAGLKEDMLNYIIEEQPYFQLVLIACGKPMIPGDDGYIIENYARSLEKTFGVNEHGNVDYRVQNYVQIIYTGDILCEAVAPTPGEDGFDVLGGIIPAKAGKEPRLLPGQNTVLSEDKSQLIAAMEGHLKYQEGKFHVKPTFYVSGDVDFNVGNIDFLGDVHVTGDVREGFVIKATGTVTVEGLVEGAVIEAGGDVIIGNGILGDDTALIKAGGSVQAEYIDKCIVYAGECVRGSSIVGAYINCDDQITVRSGRGMIIGGRLVAGRKIDAKAIGSRAERLTILSIGELPYIRKRKEELNNSLSEVQEEIKEVERTIEYLGEARENDTEKVQRVAEFRLRKTVLSMQVSHMQNKLQEMDEKDKFVSECRVVAATVYPGVQIEIGDLSYTVHEENRDVKIREKEGEIVLR